MKLSCEDAKTNGTRCRAAHPLPPLRPPPSRPPPAAVSAQTRMAQLFRVASQGSMFPRQIRRTARYYLHDSIESWADIAATTTAA
eukprot:9467653-Pyramimonas_sp.AAC.1